MGVRIGESDQIAEGFVLAIRPNLTFQMAPLGDPLDVPDGSVLWMGPRTKELLLQEMKAQGNPAQRIM